MPKPIEMKITVEEIAFVKVWRKLDAMPGVINIDLKGNGPKKQKAAKPNGKGSSGLTSKRLILNSLLAKSPKSRQELEDVLQEGGKAKTSLPDTLAQLKKLKHVMPIGKGNFKITAAGIKVATTAEE